ncbi:D-glycero-alpha-D-manno-heptose-1,7-bisphosphate 7-phosphatase [Lusitaniella coriacea]|uniref:D-glycero-alpha-D-manno-heptose-1,7-bisphosphate 7-phosphatase n=1 Tax=Lusitaniella coriacea TaxID=1983105 RepID=UPI003CF3115F
MNDSAKPAVFLDRDGVLNREIGYIKKLEDLTLISGAAKAVRRLNEANIFCCLVTNQAGAARGFYPLEHVLDLNQRLCDLLEAEAGAKLDALYYCRYLSAPAGGKTPELTRWSTWRKPNTGMLVAAAWEYNLDLKRSVVVGDKATDIDLANNVGAKGILVQTGYGKEILKGEYQHRAHPDYVAADLTQAVDWIFGHMKSA